MKMEKDEEGEQKWWLNLEVEMPIKKN